jgi:hypothetical protein
LNAIKEIRKYLEKEPRAASAQTLARLTAALAEERAFPLPELFALPEPEFQLAVGLIEHWRSDRHYAERLRLFDVVVNQVLLNGEGNGAG